MSVATMNRTRSFQVRDVSGQRIAHVTGPADASLSEMIPELVSTLSLQTYDVLGNPLTYTLRRDSDGAILHPGDEVGEVLEDDAQTVLQPSIEAGAGR